MKYFIHTYGCQMNVHDSEKIAGIMEGLGYESCSSAHNADAVIFNTCCIRETAEQKIYGHIGELKKVKRAKPNMIVAVCGCMSQQTGVADKIKESYPFVDIVLGTSNLNLLREAVLSAQNKKRSFNVDLGNTTKKTLRNRAQAFQMRGSISITAATISARIA